MAGGETKYCICATVISQLLVVIFHRLAVRLAVRLKYRNSVITDRSYGKMSSYLNLKDAEFYEDLENLKLSGRRTDYTRDICFSVIFFSVITVRN